MQCRTCHIRSDSLQSSPRLPSRVDVFCEGGITCHQPPPVNLFITTVLSLTSDLSDGWEVWATTSPRERSFAHVPTPALTGTSWCSLTLGLRTASSPLLIEMEGAPANLSSPHGAGHVGIQSTPASTDLPYQGQIKY